LVRPLEGRSPGTPHAATVGRRLRVQAWAVILLGAAALFSPGTARGAATSSLDPCTLCVYVDDCTWAYYSGEMDSWCRGNYGPNSFAYIPLCITGSCWQYPESIEVTCAC
jgi:hypothetical protein